MSQHCCVKHSSNFFHGKSILLCLQAPTPTWKFRRVLPRWPRPFAANVLSSLLGVVSLHTCNFSRHSFWPQAIWFIAVALEACDKANLPNFCNRFSPTTSSNYPKYPRTIFDSQPPGQTLQVQATLCHPVIVLVAQAHTASTIRGTKLSELAAALSYTAHN